MTVFWKTPPSNLSLSKEELHIWRATLDLPTVGIEALNQVLSIDEKIRAERFRFERDRKNFIVRRGILRTILGFYLNVESSRLQFRHGGSGKPELADTFGNGTLHFSLSHSNGVALFAFARDHEIGVDIEYMREISEMEQIAEQFFSIKENEVFRQLPKSQMREAFFKCWTQKEAFTKAIGVGLSYPLDSFDVSVDPDQPAGLVRLYGEARQVAGWSVGDVKLAPNYIGAFAVKGNIFETKRWRWEGARKGGISRVY